MSARKSHGRFRDDIYRNALILEFFAISRVFSDTRSSIFAWISLANSLNMPGTMAL